MISVIFETITTSVTSFASALGSAFTSITSMFLSSGTGGTYELTVLGTATLITAGVSLVVFAFTFLYKLIRRA